MRHTVIVPSYNTLEHTKNTYESLLKYGGDVDIIIIDDASNDGTYEWLQSLDNNNLTATLKFRIFNDPEPIDLDVLLERTR